MNIGEKGSEEECNVTATYTGLSELEMRLRVLTKGSWYS